MEQLIIECIRTVLLNEGYTPQSADVAIRWNGAEIKDIIEKYLRKTLDKEDY